MYSIGMFSKMNKVTTKTLRHYDELGLLKPAQVDQMTGYRYYTSEQILELYKILSLKQMGLSLGDIKESLRNPGAIDLFLRIKEKEVEEEIRQEKNKLKQIQSYLAFMRGEGERMYTPVIKTLPSCIIASMRQVVGGYEDFFHLLPNVMAKEMERVGCECAVPEYCFNIYHDGEYKDKDIDVEMCEAITELKENTEILTFKEIPQVDTAVCVLHKGAYSTLGSAYDFAFNWIKKNGYEIMEHPRESYIDGIWNKESEEDWLTEVQIPVRMK